MEIKINIGGTVKIDLSDRIADLLAGIAQDGIRRQPEPERENSPEKPQEPPQPQTDAQTAQTFTPQPETAAEEPQEAAKPEEEKETRSPASESKRPPLTPGEWPKPFEYLYGPNGEITNQAMRTAMDHTFKTLVGADWDESRDPAKQKLRSQIAGYFRKIATFMGYSKPTDIPQERRADFFAEIDRLGVNDTFDGLTYTHPDPSNPKCGITKPIDEAPF